MKFTLTVTETSVYEVDRQTVEQVAHLAFNRNYQDARVSLQERRESKVLIADDSKGEEWAVSLVDGSISPSRLCNEDESRGGLT